MDDPLIWGILPLRYAFDPWNLRWSLGAQDICFKNKYDIPLTFKSCSHVLTPSSASATFFSLGQVLPTHRLKHSPKGGIYQPTITEAIHLLSNAPSSPAPSPSSSSSTPPPYPHPHLSWVHIFPEGCVHQHPTSSLRYFKWGISRLILESDPTPDFVPMFVDGTQRLMPEDRKFPRFLPRVGKDLRIAFGEQVDVRDVFGELVDRWRRIRHLVEPPAAPTDGGDIISPLGPPPNVDADVWREAVEVRIETARRVRVEVMKLRRSLGYPDDDEALGLAETWKKEKEESPRTSTLGEDHVSSKR